MRPLRRLLARTLLAPLLLLPLLSCSYPKPSAKTVASALVRAGAFAEPKTVLVARRIEVHTDASMGGGALDDRQLSKIDPVVAIMHANGLLVVQDVYGPDGGMGGYQHVISIAPASSTSPELFVETDETGTPVGPAWTQTHKTPGWRVTLGRRELVNVDQIIDSSSPVAERLSPGYVLASVGFKWIPNDIGKLFDQGALDFDNMPRELQMASVNAADLDSRATYNGRAWLTRDKKGEWYVTLFDCRRCSTQS
ncbi:MAG TPA: hypothetical protein VFD67_15805 [Gemmatimonadaceae bacterium]|nr:hypothetical protein [Gemmatimonadaceae bacterium]